MHLQRASTTGMQRFFFTRVCHSRAFAGKRRQTLAKPKRSPRSPEVWVPAPLSVAPNLGLLKSRYFGLHKQFKQKFSAYLGYQKTSGLSRTVKKLIFASNGQNAAGAKRAGRHRVLQTFPGVMMGWGPGSPSTRAAITGIGRDFTIAASRLQMPGPQILVTQANHTKTRAVVKCCLPACAKRRVSLVRKRTLACVRCETADLNLDISAHVETMPPRSGKPGPLFQKPRNVNFQRSQKRFDPDCASEHAKAPLQDTRTNSIQCFSRAIGTCFSRVPQNLPKCTSVRGTTG